jgi:hypothetical protein
MQGLQRTLALLLAAVLAGCATPRASLPDAPAITSPAPQTAALVRRIDPQVMRGILAIDPDKVSDSDVRKLLATGPTPRIVALHGGIYPVHLVMESFARFLMGMGYPADKLRHPGDGRLSHSPYERSEQIAGLLAWYYESEGLMPMLVGHSQGGIQLVKVLYALDGKDTAQLAVWNPLRDAAEPRTTIRDPFSGELRPVVGLKVPYASVVAAGGAALLLPNQWEMGGGRLQRIPDSVQSFTGYSLGVDLVAWDLPGAGARYRPLGTAQVRNVELPSDYSHVLVAVTAHLARDPVLRDWINAYEPGRANEPPQTQANTANLLWAADVWHDIKKQWALQAQRALREQYHASALPH